MPRNREDAERRIADAMDRIADSLSVELINSAVEGGWPEDVAAKMRIVNRSGYLTAAATDESTEAIAQNLEFGDASGSAPNSVIGNFFLDKKRAARIDSMTSRELGNAFRSRLNGLLR